MIFKNLLICLAISTVAFCYGYEDDEQVPVQEDEMSEESLEALFKQYDVDSNGIITKQEIFDAINSQVSGDQQLLQQILNSLVPLIERFDPENDGLKLDEFIEMARASEENGQHEAEYDDARFANEYDEVEYRDQYTGDEQF